ncbi:M20/M25/M40 family metallo-hydrolase [Brevundimonas sp. Root1423]|uniref:M20/M25/M40 family metallo-hydrolase n=1 Tax=Brevundimonas sp. Root1423 TaxID=1736462 RepID=UPI0006FDB241|nr:M20/M25/M40 family metallo-hydrolase [Brevundimonas sp. Root1423]KQY96661.1 peptidase M28 [Brevundimonas sp. Root1423]
MFRLMASGAAVAVLLTGCATMQEPAPQGWTVQQSWVSAHERFLAGPELQGRGSATRDEAIAAAYMATQFEGFGLTPAPGMTSYLQTAGVTRITPGGHAALNAGDVAVSEGAGLTLYYSGGGDVTGRIGVAGADPTTLPASPVALVRDLGATSLGIWLGAAQSKGVRLLVLRETEALMRRAGGRTRTPVALTEAPDASPAMEIVILSPETFDRLAALDGSEATLDVGTVTRTETHTTNAIGFLQGTDPDAGVLLVTAHLDHLGVRPDGVVMHGANDDASGVAAVLELARAMAAGDRPRRSIMFVGYGSEELGLLGSQYFAENPPVPLNRIVANLEIEMIGQQDPNMPAGVMMMTGFDRSNFGSELKARGALIAPDIYPEQHFFERSDNYQLALQGIVAHTVSGWATTPSYHTADDTIANLNLPFMTAAIQSLVAPLRWLADSDFRPQWTAEGRPTRD